MKKNYFNLMLVGVVCFGTTILQAQNVGIGVSAPAEKLHINGNFRSSNLSGVGVRPLFADANGTITATAGANPGTWWSTLGNAGVVQNTHFIGTTDAQTLTFRTRNLRRLQITENGKFTIGTSDTSGPYALKVFGFNVSTGENTSSITTGGILAATSTGIALNAQSVSLGGIGVLGLSGATANATDQNIGVFGGVSANRTGTTNIVAGVYGEQSSTNGGGGWGVLGQSFNASGIGVQGTATGTSGTALQGISTSTAAGTTWGVYGQAASVSGIGVDGRVSGASGTALQGISSSTAAGVTWGVYGQAASVSGLGVQGVVSGTSGTALQGISTSTAAGITWGVYGEARSVSGRGLQGVVTGASAMAVVGVSTSTAAGTTWGVYGQAASVSGRAVEGLASGASGIGVLGQANGASATGVLGQASGASAFGARFSNSNAAGLGLMVSGQNAAGLTYPGSAAATFNGISVGIATASRSRSGTGIIGTQGITFITLTSTGSGAAFTGKFVGVAGFVDSASTDGSASGIHGSAGTSNGSGVRGDAGSGANSIGVRAVSNTANTVALEARAQGPSTQAINAFGNATINGNLSTNGNQTATGTKLFTIDHPTNPESMLLRHFSMESDQVINFYRGTIVLDNNGEAKVELPSYFNQLNKNFSYGLTCVGGMAQVYVKKEIANNSFVIGGGSKGLKVCWTVMAERNDLLLQQQPDLRQVEIPKNERSGSYVNPQLYGSERQYWNNGKSYKETSPVITPQTITSQQALPITIESKGNKRDDKLINPASDKKIPTKTVEIPVVDHGKMGNGTLVVPASSPSSDK